MTIYILRNFNVSQGVYRIDGQDHILRRGEWTRLEKKPEFVSAEIKVETREVN
jgi:hypothetical protein